MTGALRAILGWLALSLAGVAALVLLPEDVFGEGRVFSLSAGHGPGVSDLVGLFLILAGWLVFLAALWRSRIVLLRRRFAILAGVCAITALAGCILAVASDRDMLAVLLGLLSFMSQLALGYVAHCQQRGQSR